MLDLPDYINQDFEVPDRSSMIPLCTKGILAKVIIKNEMISFFSESEVIKASKAPVVCSGFQPGRIELSTTNKK